MTTTRKFVAGAASLVMLTLMPAGCGSGDSGTAVQQAKQGASSVAAQAQAKLSSTTTSERATTTTEPPAGENTSTAKAKTETKTVTQPAQTQTSTKTTTATTAPPGRTTSITNSTNVTPSTTAESSGGGVPWWGWALIALAVVGTGVGIFMVGRRRGGEKGARADPPAPSRAAGAPVNPGAAAPPADTRPPTGPEGPA